MKKLGFTLSELLITLGIIGVAAALAAPAVTNLMPDKNKMMFMKNYKELTTITEKMLNDKELYSTKYEIAERDIDKDNDGDIDYYMGEKYPICVGLACTSKTTKAELGDGFGGLNKYASLLAYYFGVEARGTAAQGVNFQTNDGTYWFVKYIVLRDIYNVSISIDSKEVTPVYSQTNNKNIKTFTLEVDKFGNVTPADSLSKAYLLNPNNMHNKKIDYNCAKRLEEGGTECANVDEENW